MVPLWYVLLCHVPWRYTRTMYTYHASSRFTINIHNPLTPQFMLCHGSHQFMLFAITLVAHMIYTDITSRLFVLSIHVTLFISHARHSMFLCLIVSHRNLYHYNTPCHKFCLLCLSTPLLLHTQIPHTFQVHIDTCFTCHTMLLC